MVAPAHIDVLATAAGKLEADERERLEARGDFLANVAAQSTPGEFNRTVRTEVLRLQRGDGLDRLRQQKKATYLKTWIIRPAACGASGASSTRRRVVAFTTVSWQGSISCFTTRRPTPRQAIPSRSNTTSAPSL